MDNGQKNTSFFSNLADMKIFGYTLRDVALFGVYPILKTGAVWPTQPIAKIAGVQQSSVIQEDKPLSFVQAAKRIAATPEKGMFAFWDASVASANRMFAQSLYKGPLQVFASDFSKKMIPETSSGLHFFRGLIAGGIVGITDPLVLGPLERYKTWKLLQQGKSDNFIGYIKNICKQQNNNPQGVLKEVYRGIGVTLIKQSMMNGTLFITKGLATDFVKPYEKEHPIAAMAFSSIMPGMAAAGVGAPADLLKSLIQQHTGKDLSVKELLKTTIEKSGWKGLFTGLPAKFILVASGYTVNALFLNLFEKYRQSGENGGDGASPSKEELMKHLQENAPHISAEEEPLIAQCATYITDALADLLAEAHYNSLHPEQALHMIEAIGHNKASSVPLDKFTLRELFNLTDEELKAIPPHELALKMPSGGIIALLARVVITYENQQTLEKLSQISPEKLADLSDEELEIFHAQLFGALLYNPSQTEEDTPEKRLVESLIQQFEELNINKEKTEEAVSANPQKCASMFFSALGLGQQEESDAQYFARLAQRAGDECITLGDFIGSETEESKKRTLSME